MSQQSDNSSSVKSSEGVGNSQQHPPAVGLLDSGGSIFSELARPSPDGASNLVCQRCTSTFKTRRGYLMHRALHIQKDCIRQGSHSYLRAKCEEEADQILRSLEADPAAGPMGEERRAYLGVLQGNVLHGSWSNFVSIVTDYILDIILERSRILPPKQYRRNLIEISMYLSSSSERSNLYHLVNEVAPSSQEVINPIVYRLCMKLFEFAQAEFLRQIKVARASSNVIVDITLHREEKETLCYAAGTVIRFYIAKGRKCVNSSICTSRKKCVEEKFLFKKEDIYSEEFLDVKRWFDCLSRGGLVAVNEEFFNFICQLELIVRRSIQGSQLSPEWVINELFHVATDNILTYWYSATTEYFSESESLAFLDSVVRRFVNFSGKAEAGLRRRGFEGTGEIRDVALRTSLKRN